MFQHPLRPGRLRTVLYVLTAMALFWAPIGIAAYWDLFDGERVEPARMQRYLAIYAAWYTVLGLVYAALQFRDAARLRRATGSPRQGTFAMPPARDAWTTANMVFSLVKGVLAIGAVVAFWVVLELPAAFFG